VVGRASGLAMTHGHRDFTVCSCSLLPVLLAGGRARLCARSPLTCPVRRRCATLEQKLAAGSLLWRTAEWDATMHPAPEEYPLGQRSRRIHRSRSTQPPLEAVRRPTLAFGNRHMSAPVRRYVGAPRPKSRAGSRLSLPAPNRWSVPPALSGDRRSPGRLDRLAAHLQIVGTGQRRARHRRAIQVGDRGRGDVVVQWSVTAPRHPAERLDVPSQVGVEVNRVEEMPAVHPEALLATTALSTLKRTLLSSMNAADAHRSTRCAA
jgi:hypothetical protein